MVQGRDELAGRRVTVMGLGRFGGGEGAVRFLAESGARVTVTDLRSEGELADSLARLDGVPVERLALGGHHERDFAEADLVVVNPAVRPGNRFVAVAREAGVPTTTEVALFVAAQRGRVVGVTGTNGKSTTATMIHDLLAADGRTVRLGGNIGGSLLDVVDDVAPDHWTVLELSSFQLAHLDAVRYSPDVAVVTNLAANHLDWHGSMDSYVHAKRTIVRWQGPSDVAVLNRDDPLVRDWPVRGRRLVFGQSASAEPGVGPGDRCVCVARIDGSETTYPLDEWIRHPGVHLRSNAMAAIAVGAAFGIRRTAIERGLRGFRPLPHRLEFVAEVAGRRFLDDSNATTPESVAAALASFDRPVVLLAGGYDKGGDLDVLASAIRHGAKAVALMGQTARELATRLRDPAGGRGLPKKVARNLDHAFDFAVQHSEPGDVVLLSPGCASFDWFRDYEDRGNRFRAAVHDYALRVEPRDSARAVRLRTA